MSPPPCYEASSPVFVHQGFAAVHTSSGPPPYATLPDVQPQEPGSHGGQPPRSHLPPPRELQHYGLPQQLQQQQYHGEQLSQQNWQPLDVPFSIMPDGQHPFVDPLTPSEGLPAEPNGQPEVPTRFP